MRILHVIDGLVRAGSERMLVEIANASARDGHHVAVCVTRSSIDLAEDLLPDIELLVLNRTKRFDLKAMVRFCTFVKQRRIDLMHVHGRSSFAFVVFLKTLRLFKAKVIFHDHFGGIELDETVPRWFSVWGKRYLSSYVGVYERLGCWAGRARIAPDRIYVIPNALDLSRIRVASAFDIRRGLNISPDCLVGVVVGTIRPEKGIDLLLKAIALAQHREAIKVVIIGREFDQSYMQRCKALQKALKLEHIVIFVGERADVPAIIKGADFGAIPSRSESGPLVLIEYMAASLPVIAFNVGEVCSQAAQLGVPGFVSAGDVNAFSKALDDLILLSPQKRKLRGCLGLTVSERYFEIQRVMPKWYEVYSKSSEKTST